MAELDAQIGLTADASGVEAGVGRAKKSLASLGASATKMGQDVASAGDKAGKALSGLGDGGEKSAKKIERDTKSMQSSIQRYIATLEAGSKDSRKYWETMADFKGVDKNALRPLLDQLDAYKGRAAGAAGSTASLSKSFSGLQSVLVGLGVYGVSKQFIAAADSVTTLNNQLALATGSAGAARNAYEALFDIAQRSRVGFVELGQTFASISRAAGELGIGQQRMLAVTEAIGNAMTISGGSAQGMQAALVQLSQGMASGVLRGEELNSVMEQAPRLAKALADGLGVPIGRLREMGAAGEITADKVVKALESQASVLKNEVAGATLTVSQAMTQLGNASLKAVGELDKATGASSAVASAISEIGGAIGSVGQFAKENEAVIRSVLGSMAGVGVAAGILKTAGAIAGAGGMVAAITAVRTAFLALSAVMAANPVGLALLGIGAATGAAIAMNGAPKGAERLAREIEVTSERIAKAEAQLAAAGGSRGGKDPMTARLEARIEAMRKYRNELQAQAGQTDGSIDVGAFPSRGSHAQYEKERTQALAKAEADLVDVRMRAAGVNKSYLDDLGKLSRALEVGAIGYDDYVKQVEALATSTWKSSAAGKEAEKGLKSGASEAKRAANEYQNLITSINERISAQTQELSQSGKLTESQKIAIKLQEEMASGKVKLTAAQQAEIDGRLQVLRGLEQEVKQRQLALQAFAEYLSTQEELNADYVAQSKAREAGRQAVSDYSRGIDEANDALKYELSLMGLGEQARNVAIEQYRIELDLKKQIAAVNKNEGFTQADRDEEIARLTAAAAIAKANASSKVFLDDWKRSVQQYDDIFRQGFADMLNNGKDGWKSFTKSLATTFKTTVADTLYKAFAQPFVVRIVGQLMGLTGGVGGAAVQAASGGSSIMGLAGNANSLAGMNTGWLTNFGATLPGSIASTGAQLYSQGFETLGNGLMDFGNSIAGYADALNVAGDVLGYGSAIFAAANGKWGQAIGSAVGTYFGGPIGSFIGSTIGKWADKIFSGGAGTPHTGGAGSYSAAGGQATGLAVLDQGLTFGVGERYYNGEAEKAAVGISQGIVQLLDSTAQSFGQQAGYFAATAFADDSSKDGAWGSLRIMRGDEKVLDWADTQTSKWAPKVFADGEQGQKEYAAAIATSARDALKTALGDATWAKDMLDTLGDSVTLEGLGTVVAQINQAKASFVSFGQYMPTFAGLAESAVSALVSASGGVAPLQANMGTFVDQFYSDAEKLAINTENVRAAMQALGLEMPATRDEFKALVQEQIALGEAGAETAASLLGLSGAFAAVTQSSEDAAAAAKQLAQEQERARQAQIDSTYDMLRRLVDRDRDLLAEQASAVQDVIIQISTSVDLLKSNARDLYGAVDSTAQMLAAQGMVYIEDALSGLRGGASITGYTGLQDAISAARSGINSGVYASQFERDRDALVLAGQLAEMAELGDVQLSVQERQLRAVNEQLEYLDTLSKRADDLVNGNIELTGTVQSNFDKLLALLDPQADAGDTAGKSSSAFAIGGSATGGWGSGGAPYDKAADVRNMVGLQLQLGADKGLGHEDDSVLRAINAARYGTGITQADIAKAYGLPEEDVRKLFDGAGIPRFARGGYHAGGLRLVGERGPELEATGPSRIWNQQQLGQAISAGGNARLEALVQTLVEQNARLESRLAAVEGHTKKQADQFESYSNGGTYSRQKALT